MPGRFRDHGVKDFVRLVKAVAIPRLLHPALAVDDFVEFRRPFRIGRFGREPRGHLLERLADQDRFRQRRERNLGHESPGLGKDVDQRFVRQPQDGFAHRGAAHAEARSDLPLDDRFAGLAPDRDNLGLELAVEHLGGGFGARADRLRRSVCGSCQAHEGRSKEADQSIRG